MTGITESGLWLIDFFSFVSGSSSLGIIVVPVPFCKATTGSLTCTFNSLFNFLGVLYTNNKSPGWLYLKYYISVLTINYSLLFNIFAIN